MIVRWCRLLSVRCRRWTVLGCRRLSPVLILVYVIRCGLIVILLCRWAVP